MAQRELRFRAWDNGRLKMFIPEVIDHRGNVFDSGRDYENYIINDECVVMQYTGLKDATDKEIYTGDILSEKWKCEVFQHKNTGAFMVRFHNSPEYNKPETLYEYLSSRRKAGTESRDCVIIGNIYENPELL